MFYQMVVLGSSESDFDLPYFGQPLALQHPYQNEMTLDGLNAVIVSPWHHHDTIYVLPGDDFFKL